MAALSTGRILVEAQKRITAAHRALLQTPIGPLVNAMTPGQGVLVLHTTGRKSGQPRETVLSYFDDGDDRVAPSTMPQRPPHATGLLVVVDDVILTQEHWDHWHEVLDGLDTTWVRIECADAAAGQPNSRTGHRAWSKPRRSWCARSATTTS